MTFAPEGGRKGTDYTDTNGNYILDATATKGQARIRYTATAGIVEGSNYLTISRRDRLDRGPPEKPATRTSRSSS